MVLGAGMIGREMDPELLLDLEDIPVTIIAAIEGALMVIGFCREDVDVATTGGQFGAIKQQYGV